MVGVAARSAAGDMPAACGDGADERAALREDDLDRELDLAFQGDTLPATFQDTVVGVQPEPEAGPVAQARQPRAPQRTPHRCSVLRRGRRHRRRRRRRSRGS
jgi:hypothetical protein